MGIFGINGGVLLGAAMMTLEALSFYVVFSAGRFNGAQPAFMAIGAYAIALSASHHTSLWLGCIAGLVVAALLGLIVGLMTVRLRGAYLAVASIALVGLTQQILDNFSWSHGAEGIYGIPVVLNPLSAWLIVAVVLLFMHRLSASRLGYEMRFLKEDEVSARSLGINGRKIQLIAIIMSACIAAIAGEIDAATTSYISPNDFGFALVIGVIGYVVVGGTNRYWGALLGAVFFSLLDLYTRASIAYEQIISGSVILLVIALWPTGLAGAIVIFYRKLISKRRKTVGIEDLQSVFGGVTPEDDLEPVLSAEGISKSFGGVAALESVSVSAFRRRIVGLIGPNGAGKSTLVDALSGEQRVDSGTVTVGSQDVTDSPVYKRTRLGVARTFQTTRLPSSVRSADVVYGGALISSRVPILSYMIGLPFARSKYRDCRLFADKLLTSMGLLNTYSKFSDELTWREQRTLEVARSLASRPAVLMLDEPTAGMDTGAVDEFAVLVRAIADCGVAVLIIEHNVPVLVRLVDEMIALDAGRVIGAGSAEQVLQQPEVVVSYLGPPAKSGEESE